MNKEDSARSCLRKTIDAARDQALRHAPDASEQCDFNDFAHPLVAPLLPLTGERIIHPLQALHRICSHEAVKHLQLFSLNRHWFFRLFTEALLLALAEARTPTVLCVHVLKAVEKLQSALAPADLAILQAADVDWGCHRVDKALPRRFLDGGYVLLRKTANGLVVAVNPIFMVDPGNDRLAANAAYIAMQL
jgi:hypothetical protein